MAEVKGIFNGISVTITESFIAQDEQCREFKSIKLGQRYHLCNISGEAIPIPADKIKIKSIDGQAYHPERVFIMPSFRKNYDHKKRKYGSN